MRRGKCGPAKGQSLRTLLTRSFLRLPCNRWSLRALAGTSDSTEKAKILACGSPSRIRTGVGDSKGEVPDSRHILEEFEEW
ncbi:MAG: hypothetical protein ACE5KH_06320 [Candidatus Geothermarchaeales archaeon]